MTPSFCAALRQRLAWPAAVFSAALGEGLLRPLQLDGEERAEENQPPVGGSRGWGELGRAGGARWQYWWGLETVYWRLSPLNMRTHMGVVANLTRIARIASLAAICLTRCWGRWTGGLGSAWGH